jgi:hypothetical protein
MGDSYDHPYAFETQSFQASWHNDPNFNRLVPVPVSVTNSNGYTDAGVSHYGMSLVNADIMSPSSNRCRQHGDDDVDQDEDADRLADDDDVYPDVFHHVESKTNSDVFNPLEYRGKALVYYKSLIEESYKREKSAQEGKKVASLHKAPESMAKVVSQPFEMVYEAPVGRAVVPRTLYPTSNDKRSEYLKIATKILSHKSTELDLENLVDFMRQTKKGITKKINSKIRFHFVEQLKKEGVEYQNQPVGDVKGACDAFRHELTEDLCLKLLRVFWGSVEDNDIIFRMEYEVLAECNLWYSNAKDDLSCTNDKRVVGFVKSHIANQIRMNFRKRFQRDSAHGVTLRVTQPGGRHKRRKKGEFGRSEIHGWNAPKHKEWKNQNNADQVALSIVPLKPSKQTRPAEHLVRAERNLQTIELDTPLHFIQNAPHLNYSKELEIASDLEVQPIMQVFGQKDPVKTDVGKVRRKFVLIETMQRTQKQPNTLFDFCKRRITTKDTSTDKLSLSQERLEAGSFLRVQIKRYSHKFFSCSQINCFSDKPFPVPQKTTTRASSSPAFHGQRKISTEVT